MRYTEAYERIFDETDYYYQYHYDREYFDFKAHPNFKLAQISMRIFMAKLDEYNFNKYTPLELTTAEARFYVKMPVPLQKMHTAIQILGLFFVLPHLSDWYIGRLNMDIEPQKLLDLYDGLAKNFNFLKDHLEELVFRFHAASSPYKPKPIASRETINSEVLDYDDVVGEPACCFTYSFFRRKSKEKEKEPEKGALMQDKGRAYKP